MQKYSKSHLHRSPATPGSAAERLTGAAVGFAAILIYLEVNLCVSVKCLLHLFQIIKPAALWGKKCSLPFRVRRVLSGLLRGF